MSNIASIRGSRLLNATQARYVHIVAAFIAETYQFIWYNQAMHLKAAAVSNDREREREGERELAGRMRLVRLRPIDATNASKHLINDQRKEFYKLTNQRMLWRICSVKWTVPLTTRWKHHFNFSWECDLKFDPPMHFPLEVHANCSARARDSVGKREEFPLRSPDIAGDSRVSHRNFLCSHKITVLPRRNLASLHVV